MTTDNSPKKYKDRDQSLVDFYQSLQKEFVVAELRSKIYFKSKDKKYYKRVMEGKKETITQISERNHLPNIFSNKETHQGIYEEVHNEWGPPNFTYRDKKTKQWMERADKLSYYAINAEFAIKILSDIPTAEPNIVIGRVVDNKNIFKGEVKFKMRNSEEAFVVKLENAKRIL